MRIIAVTSCPTGIAHTYMAAEALEQAAKARGHEIEVETQGAAGANRLADETIAAADAVILAADVAVRDRERFAGMPTSEGPVKRAINDANGMLDEAEAAAEAAKAAPASDRPAAVSPARAAAGHQASKGAVVRGWLMTGVSYMIPFVAAGGLLIAIAFLIGGPEIATKINGGTYRGETFPEFTAIADIWSTFGISGVLFFIGKTAFSMLVPILAGFIAYGMADRQGLVPGIVGGLLADAIGAGFLGGLIAGFLAGGIVMGIQRIPVHKGVQGLMPVVIVPLVSATLVGIVMLGVVGQPLASITDAGTDALNDLGGSSAVLLGAVIGLMMAFDMGGPVNKAAYTFGVAGLASGNEKVMAAVIVAGMTPPLAMALSTRLRPLLYTKEERESGNAAWLLGASFITEGAIPFAAADPVRVIPSMMAGSATGGALAMAFATSSPAPHGGIWIIALVGSPLLWLAAIVAGTLVSAVLVTVAKSVRRKPVGAADETTVTASAGGGATMPATVAAPSRGPAVAAMTADRPAAGPSITTTPRS